MTRSSPPGRHTFHADHTSTPEHPITSHTSTLRPHSPSPSSVPPYFMPTAAAARYPSLRRARHLSARHPQSSHAYPCVPSLPTRAQVGRARLHASYASRATHARRPSVLDARCPAPVPLGARDSQDQKHRRAAHRKSPLTQSRCRLRLLSPHDLHSKADPPKLGRREGK